MTEKMGASEALEALDYSRKVLVLAHKTSPIARIVDDHDRAIAFFTALIAKHDALHSALREVVDVSEGWMSFDDDSRFGIAIDSANKALALSEPAP